MRIRKTLSETPVFFQVDSSPGSQVCVTQVVVSPSQSKLAVLTDTWLLWLGSLSRYVGPTEGLKLDLNVVSPSQSSLVVLTDTWLLWLGSLTR
jgi:hypothetical protein